MRGWIRGIALAAALSACGPREILRPAACCEQGRQYTAWLYGSQYEKLWDRFSPDMRQTFGSVTDLATFAGQAVTRLGQEQGQVDEKVETESPLRSTAERLPSTVRATRCCSSGPWRKTGR